MPRAEIPESVESWTTCDECGWSLAQGHLHSPPIREMLPVGADCPSCEAPLIEAIDVADLPKLYAHWLEQLKEELLDGPAILAMLARRAQGWEEDDPDRPTAAEVRARAEVEALLDSIPIESPTESVATAGYSCCCVSPVLRASGCIRCGGNHPDSASKAALDSTSTEGEGHC